MKKWKLNVVDAVVILVILAAGVFLGSKLLQRDSPAAANMGQLRYEVQVSGMTREMYDRVAALLPCQMAASGAWVDGYVQSVRWEPCVVEQIEARSPVNTNASQWIKADPHVEYGNAIFSCEASVDLDGMFNMVGSQEVRIGRSHFVKSVDFELIGTILSLEKSA